MTKQGVCSNAFVCVCVHKYMCVTEAEGERCAYLMMPSSCLMSHTGQGNNIKTCKSTKQS